MPPRSAAAVLSTYARIQGDDRHRGFVLLSCAKVERPSFGSWSMAYQAGGSAGAGESLDDVVGALTMGITDRNLRAQFDGFAKLHSRAA